MATVGTKTPHSFPFKFQHKHNQTGAVTAFTRLCQRLKRSHLNVMRCRDPFRRAFFCHRLGEFRQSFGSSPPRVTVDPFLGKWLNIR